MDETIEDIVKGLDNISIALSNCNNRDITFDIIKIEILSSIEKLKRYYEYYERLMP